MNLVLSLPSQAARAAIPCTGLASSALYRPALACDFPDPGALVVDGTVYAFATNSNERRINVQVARSSDCLHWELLGDALPQLPAWAMPKYGWVWAPAAIAAPERSHFILYFAARLPYGARGVQAIGAAVADEPGGPYRAFDRPLVCQAQAGGSIDPFIFTADGGQRYLVWKNDGNAVGQQTAIFAQPLAQDGLRLIGRPVCLLTSGCAREGGIIEAPTLLQHEGRYVLVYSCNAYKSARYAICAAIADRLEGPYQKLDEPILATRAEQGLIGPGGQDVLFAPDGSLRLLFHAWPGQIERSRHLFQAGLSWHNDRPVVDLLAAESMPG